MHPKNLFRQGYNFEVLAEEYNELKPFLIINKHGSVSLNFALPAGILTLNKVLLKKYFSLNYWTIPQQNLCPTVPGRADYLYYLKDIIGDGKKSILDIGTGASAIYPILGYKLFNWNFVGTDIDPITIKNAQEILKRNKFSNEQIKLRFQENEMAFFKNIMKANDQFDASICNPPFFENEEQALRWNQKKWKNKTPESIGTKNELICNGGEKTFITNMIKESSQFRKLIKLFTCLVSKKSTIPFIEKACAENNITSLEFIEMKTGRKVSRIAVWRF